MPNRARPEDVGLGRLFETLRDAGIVADAVTGEIVLWNPAATKIFGYSSSEALDLHVDALVPEYLKAKHRAGLKRYHETGQGPYIDSGRPLDLPALRKDGEEIRIEMTLNPIGPLQDTPSGGPLVLAVIRDVTERKKVEEELKENEERFRLLVEGVKDYAIFMLDPQGNVTTWNDGARYIKGYLQQEILGRHFSIFYPEEDRKRGKPERALKVARKQGTYEEEGWRVRKDGSRFWASVLITALRDEGGELRGFSKVTRDITERKQKEEEIRQLTEDLEKQVAERTRQLQAEHARFEAVLEQMPSGVVIAEAPSGRVLLSNKRAQQIRRTPLPEHVGFEEYRQYDDAFWGFHPDGRPYEPEEWPLARSIRTAEVVVDEEIVIVRGDGSPGVILVSSSPIYDEAGQTVAAVALFYDITERRRAQEEARKLNEELEERVRERTAQLEEQRLILDTALENLAEGVLLVNLRGQVLLANPTARAMLGVEDEELPIELADLQRGLEEGLHWGEVDLPKAVARCAKEQESIEAMLSSRKSFVRVSLRPLPQFDDMRGGVLVVMQDLSSEQQLEANQQRFLANAAHELKTPLTTILGAAEFLRAEDEPPEVQRRFLGYIATEAERMSQLSETMLRLAQTGYDFREPEMQAVALEVVEQTVERMKPLAQKGDITLLVKEDQKGRAYVDPEWLEQVLLILISNAIKYSNTGGHVWVEAKGSKITIKDEGIGIREGDLPHVFEYFYQGEDASEGAGLGLPLAKDLIERMGGTISISSQEGVGTRIEIELPEVGRRRRGSSAKDTDS